MKKSCKVYSLILAAALVVSGCGAGGPGTETEGTTLVPETTLATQATTEPTVAPTTEPVTEATEPTRVTEETEVTQATEPVTEPSADATEVTEPVPTETEATPPATEVTEPSTEMPTTEATEPVVEPTDPVVEPTVIPSETEPVTEPVVEPTDPITEPTVVPTETEATDPVVDPTDPIVEPTQTEPQTEVTEVPIVTDPPVTEPVMTVPPTEVTVAPTEPTVTEPVVTDPPVTEPTVTIPPTEATTVPTEPPHVHEYVDKVVAPTCTKKGYTIHTCSCGDSFKDSETKALGHRFDSYVSNSDATCEKDGTKTAVCENGCGEKDTVKDSGSALGHSYSEKVVSPTCTEKGYTLHKCQVCGDSFKDSYTEVGEHVYHKTEYEICSQFRTQALILEVGLPANLKLEQLSISAKKITSEIPLVCAKQLAMSVIQNANTTVQCPRLSIFSETGQINASIISSGNTHATISSIQGDVSLILRGFSHIEAEINAPVQHHNWIISRKEKDGGGELAGRIHSNSGMVTIR